MGIGKDCAIFMAINSDKYTDEEKVAAIRNVVDMPTHMSIKKDDMLEVIKYALRRTSPDNKALTANLNTIKTCALVRELEQREGVETHTAEPYKDLSVSVNGPAVVLVVID